MIIKNAYVYKEDYKFYKDDILISDTKITKGNCNMRNISSDEEVIDASGLYAIPGLIDIHFHGCRGYDFCDGTIEAFKMGAKHVTHFYNAMSPFLHREPGVIGAASDTKGIYVELICDGVHIHPSVVRTTFKFMTDDRIVLISDSMEATGMPDGRYMFGGQEVIFKGKKPTLAVDGSIAGSATNLMDCMKNLVKEIGVPIEQAVRTASVNPAKAIGVFDEYGSLEPGKIANIVLLDQGLNIKVVYIKGKRYV